ncbi:MAG: EamA family transporter [Proteobacteria bacterium]|nr:EamA family transporter [Pseudomonadota bacterium]
MSGLVLVALGGFFQGLCNFSYKQLSGATASLYAVALFFVLAGAGLAGYAAWLRAGPVEGARAWGWMLAAAGMIVLSNALLFKGLGMGGPAGISYLVFNLVSLTVVAVLGMLVLGERLNLYGWAGVVCAAAALVLLANGRG